MPIIKENGGFFCWEPKHMITAEEIRAGIDCEYFAGCPANALGDPQIHMYVDDMGLFKPELENNPFASILYGGGNKIKGKVILFRVTDEGDSMELEQEEIEKLRALCDSTKWIWPALS